MKRTKYWLIPCFVAFVFVPGCVTHTNLVDNGHVTVENFATGKVKIAWSQVTEEEGELVVSGRLKRLDIGAAPIQAHVHVLELGPGNEVLQSFQSSQMYVARKRVGRGPDSIRFSVRSAKVPQPGSRIAVIVHNHNETHTDQSLLSLCSGSS